MKNDAGRVKFRGFALVELIVVITILAILATVGFLALSGYTQDARDSAIKANVRSLQTAITSEAALTNNSPRYYVVHDSDHALSGAFAYVDGTSVALTGGDVGSAPSIPTTDSNGGGIGTWYDANVGRQRPRADAQLLNCGRVWWACRIGSDYDSANANSSWNATSALSYDYAFYVR